MRTQIGKTTKDQYFSYSVYEETDMVKPTFLVKIFGKVETWWGPWESQYEANKFIEDTKTRQLGRLS